MQVMLKSSIWLSTRMLFALLLSAFSILLAACAGNALPATTPTATPPLSNVEHFSLGNFQASSLLPMAHGLLVFGTPGSVGSPSDMPPDQLGQPTALYYFNIATQALQRLVTVAQTPSQTITFVAAAGDWVVYSTSAQSHSLDTIWAMNALTHEQETVATTSDFDGFLGPFTTDGKVVVWVSTAGNQHVLHMYDLGTHHSQSVTTIVDPPLIQQQVFPVAVDQGTILYSQRIINTPPSTTQYKDGGMYLWKSRTSAPQHLSQAFSMKVRMVSQYAVWDDAQTQSLSLYDRQTGSVTDAWASSYIHPDLASDGTYVACLDYDHSLAVVIQIHTRTRTVLGDTVDNTNGAIVNGHVYWIARVGSTQFGNMLDSWLLPSA